MLVAAQLTTEVSKRQLWDEVVARRAEKLTRGKPEADDTESLATARKEIEYFRNQFFPVEPT